MKEQEQTRERLARFLARAGIASRRRAEELIAAGRVRVNGAVVNVQGSRVDPARDSVSVDGKAVEVEARPIYIALHKPAGYVSTARDPQDRPTVLDLLAPELRRARLYPVGRLDIDTSGLLLLTNDGDFAQHVSHPRYEKAKYYRALVRGCPDQGTLERLRAGVTFREDDGSVYHTSPAGARIVRRSGADCEVELTLREGRKRQVRRMLGAVGYPVLELSRVGIGSLRLAGLRAGQWRYLTPEEVAALRASPLAQT